MSEYGQSGFILLTLWVLQSMMEKVMVATNRDLEECGTVICGTRYGNVAASRGSVIPLFVNQVLAGIPITLTDPSMTRFMMTLEDAVDLVLYAFRNGRNVIFFCSEGTGRCSGSSCSSYIGN